MRVSRIRLAYCLAVFFCKLLSSPGSSTAGCFNDEDIINVYLNAPSFSDTPSSNGNFVIRRSSSSTEHFSSRDLNNGVFSYAGFKSTLFNRSFVAKSTDLEHVNGAHHRFNVSNFTIFSKHRNAYLPAIKHA